MPTWERVLAGLFLAVVAPVTLGVAAWWGSAVISMSGLYPLADQGIAAAAVAGLLLGLALVVWRLRGWTAAFYTVPLTLAIPVYLFWTAIATAWFMGLPFGNLALGAFAGLYAGRRYAYSNPQRPGRLDVGAVTALFAAGLTAAAALGIGLLAMREPYTLAFARAALGTARFATDSVADAFLVAAAVAGLFVLQFGVTWAGARAAMLLPAVKNGRPA